MTTGKTFSTVNHTLFIPCGSFWGLDSTLLDSNLITLIWDAQGI